MSWRDDFLSLTVEERRAFAKKHFKGYPLRMDEIHLLKKLSPQPKMSRSDMIEFARDNSIFSMHQMLKLKREQPNLKVPSADQINLLFGGWTNFFEEVMNHPGITYWNRRMTDKEFVLFCYRLHIRSLSDYNRVRKEHPEFSLPDPGRVAKRFGMWEMFLSCIRTHDIDAQLDLYFRESIANGKPLTHEQCLGKGIDMVYIKQILTENLFAKILNEKEKWYRENMPDLFKKHARHVLRVNEKAKYKQRFDHENKRRSEERTREAVSSSASIEEGQEVEELLPKLQTEEGDGV